MDKAKQLQEIENLSWCGHPQPPRNETGMGDQDIAGFEQSRRRLARDRVDAAVKNGGAMGRRHEGR